MLPWCGLVEEMAGHAIAWSADEPPVVPRMLSWGQDLPPSSSLPVPSGKSNLAPEHPETPLLLQTMWLKNIFTILVLKNINFHMNFINLYLYNIYYNIYLSIYYLNITTINMYLVRSPWRSPQPPGQAKDCVSSGTPITDRYWLRSNSISKVFFYYYILYIYIFFKINNKLLYSLPIINNS